MPALTIRTMSSVSRLGVLRGGASLAALALAASLAPAPARANQPFGTMVGMQAGRTIGANGQVSVWQGANRPSVGVDTDGRPLMTIEQTQQKALLDWEDFRLGSNEVLEFKQQAANWIAVNRVHGNQAAEVNGEIRALGRVYIFNDNGVLIGRDAKINTRALVTGRGFSDVNVDGGTTTLVQSAEKAALDWSNMNVAANEVLKFQQEKSSWIALNRSYNPDTTRIDGKVEAPGHIYLVAPRGLSVDGSINAQQLVLSSLYMRDDQFFGMAGSPGGGLISYPREPGGGRMDPTFSNSWFYQTEDTGYNPLGHSDWVPLYDYYKLMTNQGPQVVDPNDPLRFNVTVGRNAVINAGQHGKVILAGPQVTNKGTINVRDEGQVILAAGENIYFNTEAGGMLTAYAGAYNPASWIRSQPYYARPPMTADTQEWADFYTIILKRQVTVGETLSFNEYTSVYSGLIGSYITQRQTERARAINYTARNDGIIIAKRGGRVDFKGLTLEQNGAVDMTSTALFRGAINFHATVYDYREYFNSDTDGTETAVAGNGTVIFGKGSLTQITPDLDATDTLPVSQGPQSVGKLKINAARVHMQQDSIINMPSGTMNVLLDAGRRVFDNNRGASANIDNEDGTRFMMEAGATIDLSGWNITLEMGYHQVKGRLFAAQLADSPVQRDGQLYRKEIAVDRRFGTNLANWQGFDNLSQGTLSQFLTNGGTLSMDIGDDFIMKAGAVIDVSGGVTTYKDGYVYTTLLRRLDGSVIDIRSADPDELYMGLANEWVDYDTKWGRSRSYYIPLMSSARGQFESSYQHGGKGGRIDILAPDAVLQGTLKGQTVAGRYQRANIPAGGAFFLNNAGESEKEYVSNNVLVTALESALDAQFGFRDRLSDRYGDLFGEEFDAEKDSDAGREGALNDNTTLASADFFNRSTMGSYALYQDGRIADELNNNAFVPLDGAAIKVEAGANIRLQNGASLTLDAGQRLEFLGSVRTEGGDVTLNGMGIKLGKDSRIDTRGSWYSDFEIEEPIALTSLPRINGGNITMAVTGTLSDADDIGLVLPETAMLDASAGAWVDRTGKLVGGKGGNLTVEAISFNNADVLDIGAVAKARAYGLGGNGALALSFSKPIVIGDALPAGGAEGGNADGKDALGGYLIRPDFFTNSGFSAISLASPDILVREGTQIRATSAIMQLKDQTLYNGRPPAFWTASGTDIYEVAQPEYLTPEQRPADLRRGMNLTFHGNITAPVSTITVEKGALIATELGGGVSMRGSVDLDGTILAPAGTIELGQFQGDIETVVNLGSNARLLAPGVSLVTARGVDAMGNPTIEGEVFDGGKILIGARKVTIEKGAVLDVTGASATFDRLFDDGQGATVRRPTLVTSNGGTISLNGETLDIDDATYRAASGGVGSRGGNFSLSWTAEIPTGLGGGGGLSAGEAVDMLNQYFEWGYFYDFDGNMVPSLCGVDLSTVDWASGTGTPYQFAPGTVITGRDDLVPIFDLYAQAVKPVAPMLLIGDASGIDVDRPPVPQVDANMLELLVLAGFAPSPRPSGPPAITRLSTDALHSGGFSRVGISSNLGVIFSDEVKLGGRKADGSQIFDRIDIGAPRIMAVNGAKVSIEAGVIEIAGGGIDEAPEMAGYFDSLTEFDINPLSEKTQITMTGSTLLQVVGSKFTGFSDVQLNSGGDIRLGGIIYDDTAGEMPLGGLHSNGKLILKGDQVYAGTGRIYSVTSDTGIEIRAQDDGGPINGSPYEAAAQLSFKAPTIVQGGILRSPLGTLTLDAYKTEAEGSGTLTLLAGSLTSVSAEGRVIPYGYTTNGDTWIDPFTRKELTTLPVKTINIIGDDVDVRQGAVLDVSGGGDLYAREFVPGVGGTRDWLTGYLNERFEWVSAPEQVYAVLPDYDGNIAPLGFSPSALGAGDRVYLSGGSGLKAGYYVLLPAEYAALPGAFRVTASHRYGDRYDGVRLGRVAPLTDGSSIQAGYRVDGASGARDPINSGFHVMPGKALRMRSNYLETTANAFFSSDAFLRKSLRINRPVSDVPRIPEDGGSVVFRIGEALKLNGKMESKAATGGRGGFADIASSKIVITGAGTDLEGYDDYLKLDSDQLNSFGADSLLIGGIRRQGVEALELEVLGADVVIDNAGSVLFGPELMFASKGTVEVKTGATVETRGTLAGRPSDVRILPTVAAFRHDNDTTWTSDDDYLVHGALDQGVVLRLSSGTQAKVLRDSGAVDAMNALRADPTALAAVNALRASKGLAPIEATGGLLTIADGASLISTRSIVMDATNNTLLSGGATLQTKQLSASASQISLGAAPAGTGGLVFSGGTLNAFANAEDLTLKSYGAIDIHGDLTVSASGGLTLDGSVIRVVNPGSKVTVAAKTLTLANSGTATGEALATAGTLTLKADNLYVEGGAKWISGVDAVRFDVAQHMIGRGDTRLIMPGTLDIVAGGLTAESAAQLRLETAGAITVTHSIAATLAPFQSFGGTLSLVGQSINYGGQTRITGGTINLQARGGDLVLASGAVLDVTSNVSTFYDKTIGVPAGTVNLIADAANVIAEQGSIIDISGASGGGNAGQLSVRVGNGEARLGGTLRGSAAEGFTSGSFSLLTARLADFAGFNGLLDTGGFRQARRFEINQGDVTINGAIDVQNFAVVANMGAIGVTGTIRTLGANGGTIQLSAAQDVTLLSGGKLIAKANAATGAGGTVLLETSGRNGGAILTEGGSQIDVTGTGEGGRLVRFRAPQIGNDIAIDALGGSITGARTVLAEGYRAYDNVAVIDQAMIDLVQGDAAAFMATNAAAIGTRLGTGVTLTAGIELRNDGDMKLATDWDLSGVRFGGAAGVLTLRASGDIRIDANLSDGFVGGRLMDGDSWSFNLAAGANIVSPDSMAVLPTGLLGADVGSVIVDGKPDALEYYYDPAYGNENRLYRLDSNGRFMRQDMYNPHEGFVELDRDQATGKYIDPDTGALIEKDAATGDYVDTAAYSRRPLPWMLMDGGFNPMMGGDGQFYQMPVLGNGWLSSDVSHLIQSYNAVGYSVRTGTGAINLAAGRDLVLQERVSVIYTGGRNAPALAGFDAAPEAQFGMAGGDLNVNVAGNIVASAMTPQLPDGFLGRSGRVDLGSGLALQRPDGTFEQPGWWIDYARFQGGIGALGGGNVVITAGGDINNLGVAIPNSGRVAGNRFVLPDGEGREATALTLTGGGNLTLRAGGNLHGGSFYVASGVGDISVGGSVLAGSKVWTTPSFSCGYGCDIHQDVRLTAASYGLHTMLFTSSGQLSLRAGGDLDIEAVMDPLLGEGVGDRNTSVPIADRYISYTDTARASLFSAGGDVTLWTNGRNISLAYLASGGSGFVNPGRSIVSFYGADTRSIMSNGYDGLGWDLYPSKLSVVAATGSVNVLGGITLLPSATGQLDLLAGGDVKIGYGTEAIDWNQPTPYNAYDYTKNYRGWYQGIHMSQADMALISTPENPRTSLGVPRFALRNAGQRGGGGGTAYWSLTDLPDLHAGDHEPVRIYAAGGSIISSTQAQINVPKQLWVQAEKNIYFPTYFIQHNNPNDVSLVRSGEGIYFDANYDHNDGTTAATHGQIAIYGPGRLEIEAGTDIWIPSNSRGITSNRIQIYANPGTGFGLPTGAQDWKSDENAADIAISAGFNQAPSYDAFESAYLDPSKAGGMKDYLIDKETGLSGYLFDREYPRARDATGEFAKPEPREGLVNYVRRLQGLAPLAKKADQRAYLDTAWRYWQSLSTDFKTPYYRSVLFLELRTTGREANDPNNDRFNTTARGYTAIATLFPGAQKEAGEALAEGESRWQGNFETYASRVISTGGGKLEFVLPGGAMTLANAAARPDQTGQPWTSNPRGDALRAGVLTTDGGEINIVSHGNVTLNQSRILTSKGGNVLVWSSWGDIAAGQGAKTSISPQFYNYELDLWGRMKRIPAGLPTGAGIGTLASQPGTPPADVDLIAPAGIVDAGDAGIRVSGNFNVFAIEILGTDNIDVAGVVNGLPAAPAAPPTSLDVDDAATTTAAVSDALDKAVSQVRQNAAIVPPSLIEVRVTGFGASCDQADCTSDRSGAPSSGYAGPSGAPVAMPIAQRAEAPQVFAFRLSAQPLDDAIRAIGRTSGFNILYDAESLISKVTQPLTGSMTPEQALVRLLAEHRMVPVRIGPRTIMLRRANQ